MGIYYRLNVCAGATRPSNVRAEQVSSTAISVSWTPPSPLSRVQGYMIYYHQSGGVTRQSEVRGASSNQHEISSLPEMATRYTITMVTLTNRLPSRVTDTVPVEFGKLYNIKINVAMYIIGSPVVTFFSSSILKLLYMQF